MLGSARGRFLGEVFVICGLFGVQVFYGVNMVVLNRILSLGLDPLFLVAVGSLVTAVVLLPFAIVFERNKWPTKLSPVLMLQFVLIALGGVTIFQGLTLVGVKRTSPAIASAMPNLAPGFIFVIAACLRYEKFQIRCMYSRAKVLGTLVCLSGTIAMSFLQNPSSSPALNHQPSVLLNEPLDKAIYADWILGCFYLFVAVVILSCVMVLQAATMLNFPAPLSLCVITSMIGAIVTALLQIIMEGRLDVGSPSNNLTALMTIVLVGSVLVGACIAFQTWCVQKKGPVLVSIFSPIQTVSSAVLSAIISRQIIGLGSLTGMVLMFSGLYTVLWAKSNEGFNLLSADDDSTQSTEDVEKSLLM